MKRLTTVVCLSLLVIGLVAAGSFDSAMAADKRLTWNLIGAGIIILVTSYLWMNVKKMTIEDSFERNRHASLDRP
jgi:hypothetical protein